ncbi:MAG: cupin domain-containing protein, partial [Pseudomonadota bacterium]|nr:cupin domain-containing protein [Pseudomonadota bacterium]
MAEPAAIVALEIKPESGGGYPEPFTSRMGDADWRRLGNVFGLTQFGINLETLQPGAQSSLRHWHTLTDEFVYILEGEMVLRTDAGDTIMRAGMC